MNFLEKIDYLMELKGINKSVLSKESGVPYTTIDAFYKKGFENVKLSTIKKISAYFNTTLDYLMRDEIKDMNYGKTDNFEVTHEEMTLIEDYRMVDERGKQAIKDTLKRELSYLPKKGKFNSEMGGDVG